MSKQVRCMSQDACTRQRRCVTIGSRGFIFSSHNILCLFINHASYKNINWNWIRYFSVFFYWLLYESIISHTRLMWISGQCGPLLTHFVTNFIWTEPSSFTLWFVKSSSTKSMKIMYSTNSLVFCLTQETRASHFEVILVLLEVPRTARTSQRKNKINQYTCMCIWMRSNDTWIYAFWSKSYFWLYKCIHCTRIRTFAYALTNRNVEVTDTSRIEIVVRLEHKTLALSLYAWWDRCQSCNSIRIVCTWTACRLYACTNGAFSSHSDRCMSCRTVRTCTCLYAFKWHRNSSEWLISAYALDKLQTTFRMCSLSKLFVRNFLLQWEHWNCMRFWFSAEFIWALISVVVTVALLFVIVVWVWACVFVRLQWSKYFVNVANSAPHM